MNEQDNPEQKYFRGGGSSRPDNWVDLAQWITAVVALAIGVVSIYFTYQSRITDLEYRELAIRPALRLYISQSQGKIVLKNVGLGPAKIESVRYAIGPEQYVDSEYGRSDVKNSRGSYISKTEMQTSIMRQILNESVYLEVDKSLPRLEPEIFFPEVEEIIPVGEDITLIEIKNISEISKAASKGVFYAKFDQWKNTIGFSDRSSFAIKYCSLTGYFCNDAKKID